jgi:hypothetical protein
LTCKGVYLSEAQNPKPLSLTHCIYTCIQYILIHTGKREVGRVVPERRSEGKQFNKALLISRIPMRGRKTKSSYFGPWHDFKKNS